MSSTNDEREQPLRVVFSDVDGTLVHYPETLESYDGILALPPSTTGMRGIISIETLRKCEELRSRGVKLVIVSGVRTTTLLKRIAYLPKADAYCCESGSRIFYPTPIENDDSNTDGVFSLLPQEGGDSTPFRLVEDVDWQSKMTAWAGTDAYTGNGPVLTQKPSEQDRVAITERDSVVWKYCAELQKEGFVVDTKGYSASFRINLKHQTTITKDRFDAFATEDPPEGLAKSINLGNIDVYPTISGKKNW